MSSGHRAVSALRVGFGLLVISALAVGILVLARAQPPTGWGVAVGVAAGLVLMPLLASPLEWLVHRYVYHRALLPGLRPIYEIHHRVHHYVFFPTWRYVTSGPPRRIPVFAKDPDRHLASAALGIASSVQSHLVPEALRPFRPDRAAFRAASAHPRANAPARRGASGFSPSRRAPRMPRLSRLARLGHAAFFRNAHDRN